MRKLLVPGLVAAMSVGAAILTLSRSSRAQQPAKTAAPQPAPKAEADSIAAPRLTVADSARLKGPKQPVFFRHDIHAGQYKIQCQYCHYSVARSSEPGIPSMQTCMGCHLVIAGSDSSHKIE